MTIDQDQDQDDLIMHRATLGRSYGETAERVWELLATTFDRSRRP
jgi:hypothetical protein